MVALLLAVAIPAGVWAALQQLKAPRLWTAAAAGLAAVAPLVVAEVKGWRKQNLEQGNLLAQHLRLWSTTQGGPVVREVHDPVPLGVKPAMVEQSTAVRWLPSYVSRTIDAELDDALVLSQFVLIVGDSAAGKSRSAFEAVHRRFPDRVLLLPARRDSLTTLLNLGFEFQHAVVWLDDLDTYLGPDGLSLADLERLVGSGDRAVVVLATIRKSAYERYDQEAAEQERKLLRAARTITLDRKLTSIEQRSAKQLDDEHLDGVISQLEEYGLGEYLAAGPELVRRFENASDVDVNPVGAAVVRAAIDWRRAGLTRPVPKDVLHALCPIYLDRRPPSTVNDDEFTHALTWATQRVVATSALLIEELDGFRAFDYLLDYVERSTRFPLRIGALEHIRKVVSPSEAYRVGIALSSMYQRSADDRYISAGRDFLSSSRLVSSDDVPLTGNYVAGRDIHVVVSDVATAALFTLPPDIADFTGRSHEIELLHHELLTPKPRKITISGMAGVGKTALAIHAAHQASDVFLDGQLYTNLRGADLQPLAPQDVLGELLLTLGVGRRNIPDTLDQRVALYRAWLAHRRILVVLDNAANEAQVRPLLPPGAALITSRTQMMTIADTMHLRLAVLARDEALELLKSLAGERIVADYDSAVALVELCGRLPLAIRIVGAKLAARSNWPVARITEQLRNQNTRLENLRVGDLEVNASLQLSYEALSPGQQSAFRLLGLLESRNVDPETLAALLDIHPSEAELVLEELADLQVIQFSRSSDRYEIHDLLRLFARERLELEEGPERKRRAAQRLRALRGRPQADSLD